MKRLTVNRMLRQRLAETKRIISSSYQYEDLVNVLGGDNSKESQHRQNMNKDIDELEFLIYCLKNRDRIIPVDIEITKF